MLSVRHVISFALAASIAAFAAPAMAQQTIKIGELNSYKSQPAFLDPYKKGWEMAVEEINAKGGVLGKKLEVISRDDGANPGEAVRAAGRNPADVLVLEQLTVIVALTDAEALARLAEYREYASATGALTLMSGWTGIDFAEYAPGQVLREVPSDAIQSAVEAFTRADPTRTWTTAEIADYCAIGGDGPVLVGSPRTVADQLQEWVAETDVDGFNLAGVVMPETFEAVVDLLVPELQARGLFKRDYAEGTLRHKLFGAGDRLAAPHPVAALREEARR